MSHLSSTPPAKAIAHRDLTGSRWVMSLNDEGLLLPAANVVGLLERWDTHYVARASWWSSGFRRPVKDTRRAWQALRTALQAEVEHHAAMIWETPDVDFLRDARTFSKEWTEAQRHTDGVIVVGLIDAGALLGIHPDTLGRRIQHLPAGLKPRSTGSRRHRYQWRSVDELRHWWFRVLEHDQPRVKVPSRPTATAVMSDEPVDWDRERKALG